jgi:hypothetical protein
VERGEETAELDRNWKGWAWGLFGRLEGIAIKTYR